MPPKKDDVSARRDAMIKTIATYEDSMKTILSLDPVKNRAQILARAASFKKLKADLEEINSNVTQYVGEAEMQQFFCDNIEYDYRINTLIALVEDLFAQGQPTHHLPPQNVPLGGAESSLRPLQSRVKLEKLTLEQFDGSYAKFQAWWDRFNARYHTNTALSKVDKFEYLLNSLKPNVRSAIENLPPTGENYDVAVSLLKKRYGKKVPLIYASVMAIMDLRHSSKKDHIEELRNIVDVASANIQSLKNMNVFDEGNNVSAVFGAILFGVLPEEISSKWLESNSADEDILVDKLLEFVEKYVEGKAICSMSRSSGNGNNNTCMSRGYAHGGNNKKQSPPRESLSAFHTGASSSGRGNSSTCCFCKNSHDPVTCKEGLKLKPFLAEQKVKQSGRCFKCLMKGHSALGCKASEICSGCKARHPYVLCKKRNIEHTSSHLAGSQLRGAGGRRILLQTIPVVANGTSMKKETRALLDTASEVSWIKESLAKEIGLPIVGKRRYNIDTFGGGQINPGVANVYRVLLNNSKDPGQKLEISVVSVDVITGKRPHPVKKEEIKQYDYLHGIEFLDEDVGDMDVEILIGADFYYQVVNHECVSAKDGVGPTAVGTIFGYTLTGPIKTKDNESSSTTVNFVSHSLIEYEDNQRCIAVDEYLRTESYLFNEKSEVEDDLVLQEFEKSIEHVGEQYTVSLPWKEEHPSLMENKVVAQTRLKSLLKRFEKKPELKTNYSSALDEMEKLGFVEEVHSSSSVGPIIHYLPHHLVIKTDSKTTKYRPVFAANTKGYNNVSLNDCLSTGPALSPEIPDLMLRFRMKKIAYVADIRKAFLMMRLNPDDRDACRYFWIKDDGTIKTMRFTVITFGLTSAPFLLNATIRHHLLNSQQTSLVQNLQQQFYVDNLLNGNHSTETAFQDAMETYNIMKKASMELRQWTSNDTTLCKMLAEEKLDVNVEEETNLLGINWFIGSDTLCVKQVPDVCLTKLINHPTKRSLTSVLAHIFDPLGMVSVVMVKGKILIQKCWILRLDWDERITDLDLLKGIQEFVDQVSKISDVRVPRYVLLNELEMSTVSLHVFCDASKFAAVTCIYVSQELHGSIQVNLLISRTKIASVKEIPRMELIACLMGTLLAQKVKTALKFFGNTYYWTDSMVALWWIRNPHFKIPIFVKNRVAKIRSHSTIDQWRYVPSLDNPADIPSRGKVQISNQNEFWFTGPKWLKQSEIEWPKEPVSESKVIDTQVLATEVDDKENKANEEQKAEEEKNIFPDPTRYSSFKVFIKVTAWILRYVLKLKHRPSESSKQLTPDELKNAEHFIIIQIQDHEFQKEIRTFRGGGNVKVSPLYRLNPKLDNGLLVSVGRERPGTPLILLPKRHYVSEMIMNDYHRENFHCGPEMLLGLSREKYWIVHGRRTAKKIVRECSVCARFNAKPYEQIEGFLPADRTTKSQPFEVCGVDYAGPIYTKEDDKAYICLFTCTITRAIHLELVRNQSAAVFLQTFRRFRARRGRPRVMYSDNAQSFIMASKVSPEIEWKFIPAKAPWWGGFYERLVKSVKDSLKKTIGRNLLSFRELETVLIQVEGQLNRRPLTVLSDVREDEPTALTPNDFLQPKFYAEDVDLIKPNEVAMVKMWNNRQSLLKKWWKRWSIEYMRKLHAWHTKTSGRIKPSVGDVVLVEMESRGRLHWPLGVIEQLYIGQDGIARSAVVRVVNRNVKNRIQISHLRRPTKKLVPLEIVANQET